MRARDPSTGLSQPKHKPKTRPLPPAESCNPIWCTSPDGEGGTDCYAGGPDGEGGSQPCTCSTGKAKVIPGQEVQTWVRSFCPLASTARVQSNSRHPLVTHARQWGTYYGYTCCTTGGDGEACGDVGKKDDNRGAVVLIILALAIVIGAALTTILCCCIPGCPGHKCRKGSKPIQQTAPPAQIPMAQAQAMPMAVAQAMPVAAATP